MKTLSEKQSQELAKIFKGFTKREIIVNLDWEGYIDTPDIISHYFEDICDNWEVIQRVKEENDE